MPDSNESVVFKVEIDDSSVEKGMSNAKKKVTKAADETAEAQKKAQDSVSENADANNTKIVNSVEKSGKKVKQSADDTAESRKKAQDDTARNAEENDKKISDSTEKTSKKISDTVSREGDERVRKDKENTDKLIKHQSDYEEKVRKTAENVKKFYMVAGAALIAETTAAITAAANYQSSYAKVFTLTADGTDEAAYANSIKQAAKNTGVNVSDLSESVYGAISASVDQDKAVGFTENAVKLAKGGFTQTATAVDVLTTAINAYGKSADDAAHISDVLITTQNLGKTTVDELARSMGQTIPVANSAHTAIEELSTDYAVLTKNGVATAEAGTQIKAMYNELSAAGTKASKALQEATGKTFTELKDEGQTTADVLNTMSEYAAKSGQKLSDLFGSVEAGSAALTLVKDGGKDFAAILDQMNNSAGAAEAAYEKMANTAEEKVGKLLNKMSIMFAEAGEEMLPLVDDLISYVDDNAEEIEGIVKGIGEMMKNVIVVAGDVLKVLWEHKEAVASVAAAFVAYKTAVAISSVIDKFRVATEGATVAQNLLNVAMSANPAGLVAAGIAALTVGMVAYFSSMDSGARQLKEMSDSVRELGESAKSTAEEQKKIADVEAEYKHINDTITDVNEKKERLTQLQERLNELYGDEKTGIDLVNGSYEDQLGLLHQLNEQEKFHAKIEIENQLKETQEKLKQAEGFQFPISFKFDENTRSFIYGELNDIYEDWQGNDKLNFTLGQGASDERNLYIEGNIDEQIKLLTELRQALIDSGGAENTFAEQFTAIDERLTVLSDLKAGEENCEAALKALNEQTGEYTETVNGASEAEETFKNILAESEKGREDMKKQSEELDETAKTLIDDYGGLYDKLKDLEDGGAMNYEEMQKLIGLYPDLADKIKVTADGYTLETSALNDLQIALDENVAATISAERQKTEAVIAETENRIEAMKREMSALAANGDTSKAALVKAALDNEYAGLQDLRKKISSYDGLADYIKGGKGQSTSSGKGSVGSSTTTTSGKGGDPGNEKKYDKELKDLEYSHNMKEIDDAAYYKGIADARDKYLEKDSDKWRSANLSIKKYEDSLKVSSGKGGDPGNEKKYDKELKDLEYSHNVGEIDDAKFYKGVADLRDKYLEEDSDKWRSANVSIHNYEKSKEKKAASDAKKSKGSKKNQAYISIDSYIPTDWDDEATKNEKLKAAVGLELAGGDKYKSNVRSISQSAEAAGTNEVSTKSIETSSSAETTLADVVSAIKAAAEADENKHISLEVELKARDLSIGKVAVDDINDMTRMNGKSPLLGVSK